MKRFCPVPGCSVLVPSGRCRTHAVQKEHARPNYDLRRWYRTPRWKALRAQLLVQHAYTCASCHRVHLDLEIDHVVRHDGDPARFWDVANLQPLCRTCHQSKTAHGA